MADVTLKSGKEILFDFSKITLKELQSLHNPAFTDSSDNATIAKVSGLSVDDLVSLPFDEFRAIFFALIRKASRADDPN